MPENTQKTRSEKQKLYLTEFDVFRYLIENSSAGHPVSINEISAYYTACIDHASSKGIADHHMLTPQMLDGVRRYLDDQHRSDSTLINESVRTYVKRIIARYCGVEILPGITVQCVQKSARLESDIDNYYISMPFTETQTILLRDAISVYSYAEPEETARIVGALNSLTPVFNRESYSPELVNADKYKGSCYRNLEEIRRAFSALHDSTPEDRRAGSETFAQHREMQSKNIKKLSFVYCRYNQDKELEPLLLRDGRSVRVVDPVKILWANGFYYLITFRTSSNGEPRYINYRIDRMKEVKCLDEDAEPLAEHLPRSVRRAVDAKKQLERAGDSARVDKALIETAKRLDDKGFSIAGYKAAHPVMYTGGTLPLIRIKCSEALMNNAIDTFGFDIDVQPADEPDTIILTLHSTTAQGVKMWALEYGDSCEIIEPEELRESMRDTIRRMSSIYM